jgi:hypothetical protein
MSTDGLGVKRVRKRIAERSAVGVVVCVVIIVGVPMVQWAVLCVYSGCIEEGAIPGQLVGTFTELFLAYKDAAACGQNH